MYVFFTRSQQYIILDMDETEQLKLFSNRISKRPVCLFQAGCWFAVAATILLNKITFAGSDTRGNNYEWWRVTRVHQPGCLVVHDIDEIPIIDCPLQGIYPIGRWLNTRLPFYTQQFVPAWRGGGSGARDCIIILPRPAYYLRAVAGWLHGVAIYRHPAEFPPLATGYHS